MIQSGNMRTHAKRTSALGVCVKVGNGEDSEEVDGVARGMGAGPDGNGRNNTAQCEEQKVRPP